MFAALTASAPAPAAKPAKKNTRERLIDNLFDGLLGVNVNGYVDIIAKELPECRRKYAIELNPKWNHRANLGYRCSYCGKRQRKLVGDPIEGWLAVLYFSEECEIEITFTTPYENFGESEQFATCLEKLAGFEEKLKSALANEFGERFSTKRSGIFAKKAVVPKAAYVIAVGSIIINCCY